MAMRRTPIKRPIPGAGRPTKILDEEQIYELAKLSCTYEEIAAVMKVDADTIAKNYSDLIKRGREDGHASLRRRQYEVAMSGNTGMLIWLGKVVLGQKETVSITTQEPEVRRLLKLWDTKIEPIKEEKVEDAVVEVQPVSVA